MSLLKALPAAALLFLPSSATVQSLSVIPSSGKTEVVIGVNAAVEVQDFTLDAPVRVVVDLKGATLDMPHRRYDKESRGGITNIRYSQYRPNIVRIVIEMDAKHPYDVTRTDGEIRVSVSGGKTTDYTAWSPTPGRKPAYVATRTPTPARMASANTETKAAAAHSTPVPATPVKKGAVAAKPLSQPTQAVAQVETSSAQDDPAPAAATVGSFAMSSTSAFSWLTRISPRPRAAMWPVRSITSVVGGVCGTTPLLRNCRAILAD